MSWCEDEEQACRAEGTNPCRNGQRYDENKRQTFLQPNELARLGDALDRADNLVGPFALAALRLLILTCARLSEILTLQWSFVAMDRKIILLPDSKTGQKPLTLNDAAIALAPGPTPLRQQPLGDCRASPRGASGEPAKTVAASVAVASGGTLPVIGRQLGHSNPQTTQRYAYLADDPVRKLTQTTGEALVAAMKRKPA